MREQITISIQDELVQRVRKLAKRDDRSLSRMVEILLKDALKKRKAA